MVFVATLLSPWFSWRVNALSDLGESDVALIFNSAVIIAGVLTVPFTLALRQYLVRTALTNAGTIILMVGGISVALVGVFTEDFPVLHALFALGYFILVPAGFLMIGTGVEGQAFKNFTYVAGISALVAILVLPIALSGLEVGFAVPEMIEALIIDAWVVVMGLRLLREG